MRYETGDKNMQMTLAEIDAMIEQEKRSTSAECHSAAWAEGLVAGIEPEIIAEAALITALSELGKQAQEQSLIALLDAMREKVVAGDFLSNRCRH